MTFYFTDVGGTSVTDTLAPVKTFISSMQGQTVTPLVYTVEGTVDTLSEVDGSLISSATGTPQSYNGTAVASDGGATATQGVFVLRTGAVVGGKRLEGRLYTPNPRSAGAAVPTTATKALYNPIGAALITATSGTGPWVVWSRVNGTTRAVTSATMWDKWGIMRSRRD